MPDAQLVELASAGDPLPRGSIPVRGARAREPLPVGGIPCGRRLDRAGRNEGRHISRSDSGDRRKAVLNRRRRHERAARRLEQQGREALALCAGARYRPADVAAGVDRLETQLRRAAYRARTPTSRHASTRKRRVDVTVRVSPGPRSILQNVVVEGADATKPSIARSIALTTGAPLDPAGIRETRQRLRPRRAYRSVDIQVQPVTAADTGALHRPPVEQPVTARSP